jgi:uncharacterized protein with HEPN domain
MQKADLIRLQHMLESAKEALFFAQGKSIKDLAIDRKLTLSIVKEIEIIGEAAAKVSNDTKAKYPNVAWLDIINMRNHLIHVYFDIDLDIVWNTVQQDLPSFVVQLQEIIASESH